MKSVASQILQAAARRCLENIRGIDLFGRYADDLLVILLPETKEEAAMLVAQRLKQKIMENPVETERGTVHTRAEVSLVTNQDSDFENVEDMIKAAIETLMPTRKAKDSVAVRTSNLK